MRSQFASLGPACESCITLPTRHTQTLARARKEGREAQHKQAVRLAAAHAVKDGAATATPGGSIGQLPLGSAEALAEAIAPTATGERDAEPPGAGRLVHCARGARRRVRVSAFESALAYVYHLKVPALEPDTTVGVIFEFLLRDAYQLVSMYDAHSNQYSECPKTRSHNCNLRANGPSLFIASDVTILWYSCNN